MATRVFPPDERFGLTAQLRRAAVSIPSNLAEGAGRNSDRELLRFCAIARGSLQEVIAQLLIARDLGYLETDTAEELTQEADAVGRVITGMIRSLARQSKPGTLGHP